MRIRSFFMNIPNQPDYERTLVINQVCERSSSLTTFEFFHHFSSFCKGLYDLSETLPSKVFKGLNVIINCIASLLRL